MKKLFTLFAALTVFAWAFAGDIIVTRDAKKIDAKILEVSKSEIKYKEIDNLDGPTFILEISEISSVIYSNGKVQLYESESKKSEQEIEIAEQKVTSNVTETEPQTSTEITPDIIYTISGDEMKVVVENVKQGILYYKDIDNIKGETFTISTKEIADVRYANGVIQTYNMRSATQKQIIKAEKAAATTAIPDINRVGKRYFLNQKELNSAELKNYYLKYCPEAYNQYNKGYRMYVAGDIILGTGAGLGAGLLIGSFLTKSDGSMALLSVSLVSEVIALGVGLPLTVCGGKKSNNAYDIYKRCQRGTALNMDFGVTGNGVTMSLYF